MAGYIAICYFNPRSRVGSDDDTADIDEMDHPFQSTLPRGERPDNVTLNFCIIRISIHAPAWGATAYLYPVYLMSYISIHAPAWGATRTAFAD